ncbi:hypothetical protein Y032_0001g368 [Ancylostoma ceylanicum]|uniref:Mos1 transposase HTH domain-containing protein n=1 Tax=Ancylostoma ceylanicum TaxID=53326 RepID=A0A016W3A1_9BILA|nr:hypothetical protein Y032_0001g368 [Ancylostoma ceylanicum]
MVSRRDFRVIMLYEFKLSHSAAEAARNIALAFGTDSPSERTVRRWFAKFSSGDFDLEDEPDRGKDVAGRSSTGSSGGNETRYYYSYVGGRPGGSLYYSFRTFGPHRHGEKNAKVDTP